MRSAVAALLLSAAIGSAWAGPSDAADPIAQFLQNEPQSGSTTPAAGSTASPTLGAVTPGLLDRVQDRASEMVFAAMNYVGVRYRRGGNSAETGFDCSGFTRHVFNMSLGLVLPRRADEQAAAPGLAHVNRADLQPGDLVFFRTMKETFSHVGIYIGNNRFIHSPRSGEEVRTENMGFAYWAKRFTGARRAELPATASAPIHALAEGARPNVDPARAAATPQPN